MNKMHWVTLSFPERVEFHLRNCTDRKVEVAEFNEQFRLLDNYPRMQREVEAETPMLHPLFIRVG